METTAHHLNAESLNLVGTFQCPLQGVADIRRYYVNLGDYRCAIGLDIVAAVEEAIPALRSVDLRRRPFLQLSVYHGRHDYDSGQHVAGLPPHVLRRTFVELELGNCRGYSIGKKLFCKQTHAVHGVSEIIHFFCSPSLTFSLSHTHTLCSSVQKNSLLFLAVLCIYGPGPIPCSN